MNKRAAHYPFDWFIIGYCLLMAVMCSLLGRPVNAYMTSIVLYLTIAGFAALIMLYVDESRNRFSTFVRVLYPVFLFAPLYSLTGGTMHLLFDRFLDPQLVAFELALLGFHPTIYIDQHLLNVITTEILSFCYFSYYFMVPAFFFSVFIRKDYDVIKRSLSGVALTYLVSYLVFTLYPIEGPRWHFANLYANGIDGVLFRDVVNWVIGNGAVRGGAMPSSHTGVALAIMVYCFKFYRPFGWVMLPIVVGLATGTVWGRFHYVSDVVVGSAIAAAAIWITERYYDRWTTRVYKAVQIERPTVKHAT